MSGAVTLTYESDGTNIDEAPLTGIGTRTLAVNVAIDNYATVAFEQLGTIGNLTDIGTHCTLDLGILDQDSGPAVARFGVINSATGLADVLAGKLSTTGGVGFVDGGSLPFAVTWRR